MRTYKSRLAFLAVPLAAMMLFTALAASTAVAKPDKHRNHATLVLLNGDVYTMDAAHPHATAVAIRNGKILAVGTDKQMRRYIHMCCTKEVRDLHGLTVTPGFIDTHNHLYGTSGLTTPIAFLRQGVTTVITGVCGGGPIEVADHLAATNAAGTALNFVTYVGANTLRHRVGVPDIYTAATPEQIEQMVVLADQAMDEGAIGVSFGTEYEPGQSYLEILALARVAAAHKGHISSHIRTGTPDPPFTVVQSINEIIDAGRTAGCPVQISHIGSMAANMMTESLQAIIDARAEGLDVTADCYPYDAWSTGLKSAVFDPGWQQRFRITYSDIEVVGGPYAGQRLTEDLFNQLRNAPGGTSVIAHAIPWADVIAAYQSPFVMVGSDGSMSYNASTNTYSGHPRGAGTFPRVIGQLARQEGVLSFEQAVFKMTVMPAVRAQLYRKGMLKPGFDADVAIFDKDTFIDTATYGPNVCYAPPIGLDSVYVNGKLTLSGTAYLGTMAGKAIAHKEVPTRPVPMTPGQ